MSGCYDSALYNTGEVSPWDQAADYKQTVSIVSSMEKGADTTVFY